MSVFSTIIERSGFTGPLVRFMPTALESLGLFAFTHSSHLLLVGSWGLARLSPAFTFNGNWYHRKKTTIDRRGFPCSHS
ncbi:MAG: hypothetical protein QS721_07320 [Candidatus Endonucleobacter sp. (ex Gigantidas childressi)]|nr:hypothetical protein [Candidatus Endonucleobacter sp. (ex Gigantidas childressi)]